MSIVPCTIDYTTFTVSGNVSGKVSSLSIRLNHTSWVAVVTPTDCPKSPCVIEVFGGVFVLSRWFSDLSVGVGAFVIGLSQISSFFSFNVQ